MHAGIAGFCGAGLTSDFAGTSVSGVSLSKVRCSQRNNASLLTLFVFLLFLCLLRDLKIKCTCKVLCPPNLSLSKTCRQVSRQNRVIYMVEIAACCALKACLLSEIFSVLEINWSNFRHINIETTE